MLLGVEIIDIDIGCYNSRLNFITLIVFEVILQCGFIVFRLSKIMIAHRCYRPFFLFS